MSFDTRSGPVSATVTALADVATIYVRQQEVLWVSFVVGVAALSQFVVQGRVGAAGTFFTLASAAADFTAPPANGVIIGASGDLTTAAGDSTTARWIKIDVKGLESIKLRAAGTASTITGAFEAQ